jgi:dTMP kinase
MFIVIEGIDGSGKQTLTTALAEHLTQKGLQVAQDAFPRYGRSLYADLVSEALHGAHGDLPDSVYGMGTLYALDRKDAARDLRLHLAVNDVLLCDRYVASNVAYGAARLHEDVNGDFTTWAGELEFGRFGIPVPDLQILLDVPPAVAKQRAIRRGTPDVFERDDDLQQRVAGNYRALAARGWMSDWQVLVPTDLTSVEKLVEQIELPRSLTARV